MRSLRPLQRLAIFFAVLAHAAQGNAGSATPTAAWCLVATESATEMHELADEASCSGELFLESPVEWGHGLPEKAASPVEVVPGGLLHVGIRSHADRNVPAHFVARALVEADDEASVERILCRRVERIAGDEAQAFVCGAPVGVTAVAVDLPGSGTTFVWRVNVTAGEPSRLEIEPKPSIGVTGTVSVPGLTARLVPRGISPSDPAWDFASKTEALPAGGDFELPRVAPGSYLYRIEAPSGDASAAQVVVPAMPGGMFELPDLAPPTAAKTEIQISPALDGADEAWSLTLARKNPPDGDAAVRRAQTDLMGWTSLDDLDPGEHVLLVEDSTGSLWWSGTVEIGEQPLLSIELPHVAIRGRARRGDAPFQGTLIFGTTQGVRRITMPTDEEGRFDGLLPREGEWQVEIAGVGPTCASCDGSAGSLRIPPVWVEEGPSGKALLRIEIPDTRVAGRVLLEEVLPGGVVARRPFEGALVVATRTAGSADDRGRLAEVWTDDAGRFELIGMAPGQVSIAATSRDPAAESRFQSFDLRQSSESAELELVLTEKVTLVPRVQGPGGPIGGAKVTLFLPDGISAAGTTGVDGTVPLAVPPGRIGTLAVRAEGFGLVLRAVRTTRDPRSSAEIPVHLAAGEGSLVLTQLRADVFDRGWLASEGGGSLPLRVLASLAPGAVRYGASVTLSGLGPEPYVFCIGDRECWSGEVFPGAATELDLSRPER